MIHVNVVRAGIGSEGNQNMQIINNPLFGVAAQFRQGVKEFNPGGGGLEPDLAYRLHATSVEVSQNPGKAAQFVFRCVIDEPGFEGTERSIYVEIPQALNATDPDRKRQKGLEIRHDEMLTTIISIGYPKEQAMQIAAQGNTPYGTIFQNAPGRGNAFAFAESYDRKVIDKATNTVVMNPSTGQPETEERTSLKFCTPEHYAKHSASGRAQRAQAAQQGGGFQGAAPSYNPPAAPSQPQYAPAPQPNYGAPAPAPQYGAQPPAPPQGQPNYGGFQPQPNNAGGVPTGYTVPATPNGQYGAPQAGGIMGTMQQPRA